MLLPAERVPPEKLLDERVVPVERFTLERPSEELRTALLVSPELLVTPFLLVPSVETRFDALVLLGREYVPLDVPSALREKDERARVPSAFTPWL